jgi:hypothetical protein
MHLTGIMLAMNTKHIGYYITDYSNRPTRSNPLDKATTNLHLHHLQQAPHS